MQRVLVYVSLDGYTSQVAGKNALDLDRLFADTERLSDLAQAAGAVEVGAGTGFGARDIEFEVPDERVEAVVAAISGAGLAGLEFDVTPGGDDDEAVS